MHDTRLLTHETRNNYYYIGYGKTAKTSYEQQQEQRKESLYMMSQRLTGALLFTIGIVLTVITKDATAAVISSIIGIPVILTKDHVICL